jgi:hypothetical protein
MDDITVIDSPGLPPYTNGGVVNNRTLTGVSVDYLTLTVPSDQAQLLLDCTDHEKDGHPNDGFGKSELRLCQDGKCWRRHDPHQESKDHGKAYESWKWPGCEAGAAAKLTRTMPGARPSFIDIAFDFACDDNFTPDDFIDEIRGHVKKQGLTVGISGQNDINTRYVGGPTSNRRTKIYRKDWQDQAYAKLYGPTLRVEVTLKDQHAHRIWELFQEHGQDKLYSVAAAHLEHMTGVQAFPTLDDVPELVPIQASRPGALLAAFVKQNAGMLSIATDLGIDLAELVKLHQEQQHRAARSRTAAKRKDFERAGVEDVVSIAKLILEGDQQAGAA